jgi:hypothetical protein
MIDRLMVIDFAEGLLVDLLFIVALFLLAAGCSLKVDATPELVAAEKALARAEQEGVAEHLPTTMQRAREALAQAHGLHRQQMTDASAAKATEASLLVDQAVLLDQRRQAWDVEIERYFQEQLSQQLMVLLLVELAQRLEGEESAEVNPSDTECPTPTALGL